MEARHKEAMANEASVKYKPLRSDEVGRKIAADPEIKLLLTTITNDFPKQRKDLPNSLARYWAYGRICTCTRA